ncbi:MAG: hypothetical protein K0S16_1716, partial [Moraxellaceae bacterium]|nr:hypothetical protein [Moraxellaceae bacterium]
MKKPATAGFFMRGVQAAWMRRSWLTP